MLHSLWNYVSVKAMADRQLRGRGMLVLDQGLVQAIWSARMCGKGSSPDWSSLIGRSWFEQCMFVHVEAPTDVAAERLATRPQRHSRMQRQDRLRQQALWSKGEMLIDQLGEMIAAELLRLALPERLLRIRSDVGSDPAKAAELIVAHTRDWGRQPARAAAAA